MTTYRIAKELFEDGWRSNNEERIAECFGISKEEASELANVLWMIETFNF